MSVYPSNYWQLLSHRAAGKVMTNAHWTRQFIRTHPEYRYIHTYGQVVKFNFYFKIFFFFNKTTAMFSTGNYVLYGIGSV
jgi:hypothetical protein